MITPAQTALVRYGAIPEVARFRVATPQPLRHRSTVVVQTHRGLQLGTCLQLIKENAAGVETSIVREATPEDQHTAQDLRQRSRDEFAGWSQRISEWKLDLELLDLEYTLDGEKLILFVLNDRGSDCTRLAIQAAAAGLGLIEVQPVDRDGLVSLPAEGGGCGSGGCGCSH